MKEIKQNKKNKEAYKSPIIKMLQSDEPVSKEKLMEQLHVGDRYLRLMISECSMFYPVVATSDKKGYRIAKKIEGLTGLELEEEKGEVNHQLNELRSRVKWLKKRMKPLIAYLKVLEKREFPLTPEKESEEK